MIMSKPEYSEIQLNLDDDVLCQHLELYLKRHLSKESFSIFADASAEIGLDFEPLCTAAGRAIANEAMIDSILKGMHIEMENRKIKGNNNE
jgi:hypothetical protein